MVVNQVVLLRCDVKLSHEAGHSKFLNDRADVELAIEAATSLALELVGIGVLVLAAEAPRA